MDYKSHPSHYTLPIIAVILTAAICYLLPCWEMVIALFVVSGICVLVSLHIYTVGKVQEESEYWMWIGDAIEKLKNSEPEIWTALGFKEPPNYARIEITKTEQESEQNVNPYVTSVYDNVPISPVRLQVFADGVLSGRQTLSEGSWKGVIPGPKFRNFQDWMEKKNLIAKVNPEASTQGYILTESGEKWLLEHASPNIRNGVGGGGYVRVIPIRSDRERV